jgi:hypothetical protein
MEMDMVHASARSSRVQSLPRFAAVVTLVSMSLGGFPGHASAAPGSQLWAKRYNGPGNRGDFATAQGVSPDGSEVFVTGYVTGSASAEDYGTVAYDASTGDKLWAMSYNGAGNSSDAANALGVSPDGSTVFVTGDSTGSTSGSDYATVAYDASTGTQLWAKRYNGPGNSFDGARALGVSPDGSEVFVTGQSLGSTGAGDYATVAYDASTGTQLWVKRYNGAGIASDGATALGVSPDGSTVFVTGDNTVTGSTSSADYATVAYDATTGAKLWVKRYNGPGNSFDGAGALGVSPDGSQVFVTGLSTGSTSGTDYATVAYATTTGHKLWVKRYNGPGNRNDVANALGVSPDGSTVFVTGESTGSTSALDYATVAYDATTGHKLWVKRYNGPGNRRDVAHALGVSPDGSEVFVTGQSIGSTSGWDYATVAYDPSTGAKLWVKRYNGPGNSSDLAYALRVSPDGTKVFVTGGSMGSTSDYDYATVAYSAA